MVKKKSHNALSLQAKRIKRGKTVKSEGIVMDPWRALPFPYSLAASIWRITFGVKKRCDKKDAPIIDHVVAEVKSEWERGKVIN
jgi:hypothetical protein